MRGWGMFAHRLIVPVAAILVALVAAMPARAADALPARFDVASVPLLRAPIGPTLADFAGDQSLCNANGSDFAARGAACTRQITSGHWQGHNLAISYRNRGLARLGVAEDGGGHNSPFTAALLKNLPTLGLELRTLMTRVRAEVVASTHGEQRPEVWDSLVGEFTFQVAQ